MWQFLWDIFGVFVWIKLQINSYSSQATTKKKMYSKDISFEMYRVSYPTSRPKSNFFFVHRNGQFYVYGVRFDEVICFLIYQESIVHRHTHRNMSSKINQNVLLLKYFRLHDLWNRRNRDSIISGIVYKMTPCRLWYLSTALSFDQTDPNDVKFNGFTYVSIDVFFFFLFGLHSLALKFPPISSFHVNGMPLSLSTTNTNSTHCVRAQQIGEYYLHFDNGLCRI